MATISITIPDAQVNRVQDAFAAAFEYQATIDGAPNPETKAQHARRRVREYAIGVVRTQEARSAAESAAAERAAQVNADFAQ